MALLLTAVLLAACRVPVEIEPETVTPVPRPEIATEPATAVIQPEATYTGSKDLVVCLPREPETLYRYGRAARVEKSVLHGIYENDYTHLSFAHQPQGLVKLPNLADGDAIRQQVTVKAGDRVVDADGAVIVLAMGARVRLADGETAVFAGAPLVMAQLTADFSLKARVWADGVPVTAADSVYSFELAAHPITPAPKNKIERTASYTAVDETSVRWVGLPGFDDATYFTNFWGPLPRHAWQQYTPAELLTADVAHRFPLGDGPFQVVDWIQGQYLRLEPNPFYYRAVEGLPHLDSVTFRFLPDADRRLAEALTGACDIVTQEGVNLSQASLFLEAESGGLLTPVFQIGTVYEAITLGIHSWGNYGDGLGRPDWFEDARVRQGLALCLNRQAMVDELFYGRSEVMHSQIPSLHPLYSAEIARWPYDPATGAALLDAAGYRDANEDGLREDPQTGQPFRITYTTTTEFAINQSLAAMIQADWRACGVDAEISFVPVGSWYAAGEESPLFGRRFDAGQIAWPVGEPTMCHLFASWEITGPDGRINPQTGAPYGSWDALNNTGWWLPQFDDACRKTRALLPGMPGYEENFQETQRLLAENLPMIPLFMRLKLAVIRPGVRNFNLDPTQDSELWNLFALDLGNSREN
ncbi:MAG: peptide ABC transporter substrate-binding protein [Chloroflexi bacterium]|nr:peptide ABC transporter substrate-binding protein [Chloroflexota bacterium]